MREYGKILKKIRLEEYAGLLYIIVFLFVITFLFLLNSPLHIWVGSDSGTDSSVFKTVAFMMDKGYMPYRDTFDHKGPWIYILNWIGDRISAYRGIWVVEFINLYLTFAGIYKIARLKCGKICSAVTLLVAASLLFTWFKGGNYTEEYALPFITVSLYIFLDYLLNQKAGRCRLIVCGLSFGAVCLLRVNMISVWIVFCMAIFIKCIFEKKYSELRRFVGFFMSGFCIIVIPVMLWLFMNHALQDFWEEYIRFNLVYTSAAGGRALFSAKWEAFFEFSDQPVLLFCTVISVYMCRRDDKLLYGLYICYVFVTLLLISMAGMTYGHYGMILVPAAAFPVASLFGLTGKVFTESAGELVQVLITACFLCVIVLPDWLGLAESLPKIYSDRETEHTSGVVNAVCRVIEENTSEEDRISVYGNWDIIYIRSGRVHATRYSYQYPIGDVMPGILDEYWEELERELPEVIVVQPGQYDRSMADFVTAHGYQIIWEENEENGAMVFAK